MTNPPSPPLKYPGLHETSSRATRSAQKKHFRLVQADLLLLTLAAATSASSFKIGVEGSHFDLMVLLTGALLIASLLVAIVARTYRFDRRWFSARAIAESAKIETWRYMMGVAPYALGEDEAIHDKRFREMLKKILEAQHEAHAELSSHGSETSWSPQEMVAIRALSLQERGSIYLERRLKEQWNWYKSKAQANDAADRLWSWLGLGIHGLAVILVLVALVLDKFPFGWVGLLTTLAAAFIAWAQGRSYQQLAQSYALIAQELSALVPNQVPSQEKDLAVLVEEVERTISREHTLWLMRRL